MLITMLLVAGMLQIVMHTMRMATRTAAAGHQRLLPTQPKHYSQHSRNLPGGGGGAAAAVEHERGQVGSRGQ
jgi:hypothetical protein